MNNNKIEDFIKAVPHINTIVMPVFAVIRFS